MEFLLFEFRPVLVRAAAVRRGIVAVALQVVLLAKPVHK
jgi:hypothetical protein